MDATKHDQDKIRLDLISPEMMYALGEVLTVGAIKYGEKNWEKGMVWSRVFGATLRHLWTWYSGTDADAETKLSHLKHAFCNIGFLITYEDRKIGTDDRQNKPLVQDDGYYSRDRLVRRFDDVLDSFVFSTCSTGHSSEDHFSDLRSGIRAFKDSTMGAGSSEEEPDVQDSCAGDDTWFPCSECGQYHGRTR